jgi:sugar phosphate isomerase/epimerase
MKILRDHAYDGHLSIECEGQGGPMLEKSLGWLRTTMRELDIREVK